MSKDVRLNDETRRQWVENDEGLYNLCRAEMRVERISKREWIKRNRGMIDQAVELIMSGKEQAHFMAYGVRVGRFV